MPLIYGPIFYRIMIQEIIVIIILLLAAAWLMRRIYHTLVKQDTHPCDTCTTPCKLKNEIHKNKRKRNKKCTIDKENMPKN